MPGTSYVLQMNADNAVARLFVESFELPYGVYTGTSGEWINGTSNLTVGTAASMGFSYWDINGTSAGAGGSTPSGVWDGSASNWNSDFTGGAGGTVGAWTAGSRAVFAAGNDATGSYTVTVAGTQDISGLYVEEGNVTISGGTALRLVDDSALYAALGSSMTISTAIIEDASSRSFTKIGDGTVTLQGANSYSGGTTLAGGILGAGHDQALGTGTLTFAGGTLGTADATPRSLANSISLDATVSISTPGDITFTDASSTGLGVPNNQQRAFDIADGTVTFNQVFTNTTGTNGITKTGAGTMVLNGASSYTRLTVVDQGTLVAGTDAPSVNTVDGAFGRANSEVTVGLANGNIDAAVLTGGAVEIGRNIRVLSANNNDTGARTITLGGATADASTFSGNIILGTNNNATKGIELAAAADGTVTFSGVIQNPGGQDANEQANAAAGTAITVTGPGTVVLTGNNTYTGQTLVSAGTLLVNNVSGSGTGTGDVTVLSGATLGGSGTIAGSVTLNGATISPGASIGTLTTGDQIWAGAETFKFELSTDGSTGAAGTGWDLLAINGSLDLSDATSVTMDLVTMLNATDPGPLGTWDPAANATWAGFVTTTQGITGFDSGLFSFNTSGFQNPLNGTFSVLQNGTNLDLFYLGSPEPSRAILFALGLLALLGRRRR